MDKLTAPTVSLAEAQRIIVAQQATIDALTKERDAAFKAGQFAATDAIAKQVWNDGCPPHPYGSEWFIAKTKYGDKVVLRALPDDHSYDYETADGTYMIAANVVKWLQFPDSNFIPYIPALIAQERGQ